jgi:hypothetical protein
MQMESDGGAYISLDLDFHPARLKSKEKLALHLNYFPSYSSFKLAK